MYILFINLDGRCDIFFSAQFNNNNIKKSCPTHGFNQTHVDWVTKSSQPDPCTPLVGVHTGNTRRGGMMRTNRSQQLSDVRNSRFY